MIQQILRARGGLTVLSSKTSKKKSASVLASKTASSVKKSHHAEQPANNNNNKAAPQEPHTELPIPSIAQLKSKKVPPPKHAPVKISSIEQVKEQREYFRKRLANILLPLIPGAASPAAEAATADLNTNIVEYIEEFSSSRSSSIDHYSISMRNMVSALTKNPSLAKDLANKTLPREEFVNMDTSKLLGYKASSSYSSIAPVPVTQESTSIETTESTVSAAIPATVTTTTTTTTIHETDSAAPANNLSI